MSNRTLLEFNHDNCPKLEDAQKWAEGIIIHLRTGDIQSLPQGVTFKNMRHHSDPELSVKVDTSVIEFVCEHCGRLLHRGNAQDWMDINDSTICPKAILGLSHKATIKPNVPQRTIGS